MYVQPKDIRICLDKAREMGEHYVLYVLQRDFPRSVVDLKWICEEYLHLRIRPRLLPLPAAQSSIRGLYMSTPDGYEIYLLSGMNYCWNRFVFCKEMFHVLLDKDEYRNMQIYEHIEEVALKFPEPRSHPSQAAVSELMAEIAAMEFLFPFKDRLLQLGGKPLDQVDSLAIAQLYKIPQYYVEKYLSQPWMEYIGAFH